MSKKRLGDLLLERGSLVQDDLDQALAIQREKNIRLGEVLMHSLRLPRTELAKAIEQIQGVTYAVCPPESIPADTLALIPRATAVKCCALPLEVRGNTLIVAVAEPQDFKTIEELRFRAGKAIAPRFSFRDDILAGIRRFYDHEELRPRDLVLKELTIKEPDRAKDDPLQADPEEEQTLTELEFVVATTRDDNRDVMKELRSGVKKQSVAVRFISMILARAARRDATDIHIEPHVSGTVVRMRIDGILRELMKMPSDHQVAITTRIKAMADMDCADQRRPQSGRFIMIYKGRRLDVRVSTLPTYFGEKVVVRILDPRSTLFSCDQLGLSRQHEESLKRILSLHQGMLIVSGPAGSGRSTTLYSALSIASSSSRNITTIEDPIESIIEGITQVEVDARAGLTMAAALRPILGQNPNVVMVGEIDDTEIAEISLRAAQTGHLILTTLHTNDSVDAIIRLREVGLASNLISSISGVISQRLVRVLCACRKKVPATELYSRTLQAMGAKGPVNEMFQPGGCAACDHSGYKGRIGIFEMLVVDSAVRDAIHRGDSDDAIRALLCGNGFQRMQEDALDKISEGVTTLDEAMRLISIDSTPHRHCVPCGRQLTAEYKFCPICGTSAAAN